LRRFDIVVTTIFQPAWLEGYLDNIKMHGHAEAVTIRIIADRKTPASVYEAARHAARSGFEIDCPDLDEQEQYLRALGLSADFVPWDSDNRRNIGYLRAWEHGADVLISIDDDNFCRSDSDFIACHGAVGLLAGETPLSAWAGGSKWFNVCDLLDSVVQRQAPAPQIYARGFPYDARDGARAALSHDLTDAPVDRSVAVNAGLWIDDPDVDAVTRLALRPITTGAQSGDVLLAPGTWTPLNTQNTALHRDAIPSYYYVRMGLPVKGMLIDRFGDIWSGYFLQRCAQHLGEVVRVGSPIAEHRRTSHNLFKDLYEELAGIVLTEELLPWLREVRLTGTTYQEAYAELAELISEAADRFSGFLWDDGGREFLRASAQNMRTWLGAIRTLSGS
jgi:Reversibly glycosylated polypeptide